MEMEELYDRMSELLDQASNMCNEVMISNPYDAIDALTDLMEESGGYDTQIGDLIDEIAQTMDDIDSMESQEYFEGGMDEEMGLFEEEYGYIDEESYQTPKTDKRRERFLGYGVKTINKTLEWINKLKRFNETSNYIITKEEKEQIISLLRNAVDDLEKTFKPEKKQPMDLQTLQTKLGVEPMKKPETDSDTTPLELPKWSRIPSNVSYSISESDLQRIVKRVIRESRR